MLESLLNKVAGEGFYINYMPGDFYRSFPRRSEGRGELSFKKNI